VAEKLEQLLQRALEADALLHRVHLAANAADLAEADRMNVVRREVRRRVPANEIGVARLAIG